MGRRVRSWSLLALRVLFSWIKKVVERESVCVLVYRGPASAVEGLKVIILIAVAEKALAALNLGAGRTTVV